MQGQRFTDKVCVINGAASEIGAAVAARLEGEGAIVVGVDRQPHDVGQDSMEADLTDEAQVVAMYAHVVANHGRLDVIYNNMGRMGAGDGSALHIEIDSWHEIIGDNLTTIFLCCKHGIPRLIDTDPSGGAVVNAASFLAGMGAATAPMAYTAAKAAVVQLTRDLGVSLARSGVRVNAVLFGPISTAAQRAILGASPDTLEKRLVHWPTGRFGSLEEATDAVAFLASDDAGYLTSVALPLDGGIAGAFTVPE